MQGMVVRLLPEMFSFDCQNWLAYVLVCIAILDTTGLKKICSTFYPVKSKIQSNRVLFVQIFVHLTPTEFLPTVSCSFSLLLFSSQ